MSGFPGMKQYLVLYCCLPINDIRSDKENNNKVRDLIFFIPIIYPPKSNNLQGVEMGRRIYFCILNII